jgi:hypothetical protein
MNIQTKITLHSQDAAMLSKIKIGNELNLLEQAMKKLGALYKACSLMQVYAWLEIMAIKRDIDVISQKMMKHKRYWTRKIEKRLGNLPKTSFPMEAVFTLETGTPLHFEMATLVQTFDEVICLLRIAKAANVFTTKNDFFKRKSIIKKELFSLITKIAFIKNKQRPAVTLDDYFAKNETYSEAKKTMGEVDSTLLYLALQSNIMPISHPKILNLHLSNLRKEIE